MYHIPDSIINGRRPIVSVYRATIFNFLVPRMIVSNRNNFLRITIVLIIVTFSKELSTQRTPRVREDIYQRKRNANSQLVS